ncbi:hypothetical protein JQX13_16555 [Archangium violaceum]|uniref:hypothetical protein n=1 Tax=Archangium violaceum TaxID=83451 RepID=UPI00193BDE34|nr:hypothetical protein [Archangium violaceum]QRK11536.1 hypothetical protein JQX13_16555 [Archangium violaceum]
MFALNAHALLMKAKTKNCDVVVLPAGFWSARDNKHRDRLIADAQKAAQAHGVALIAGVDVVWPPVLKEGIPASMVKNEAIPFFGFAVTRDGTLHGPWQQLSIISAHTGTAPAMAHRKRIVDIAGTRIIVLICGEMLNEDYRQPLGSATADLVVDIGHSTYKRVRQTMRVVARLANKPALHVQHLSFMDTMIFIDRHGQEHNRSAGPDHTYLTQSFWYGWTIRDI